MEGLSFIHEYTEKMKEIEEVLLNFIDNEECNDCIFEKVITFIENQQICKIKHEFKTFLHIISKISNHYHRSTNFFFKIESILKSFKPEIKRYFTNYAIFNIFKGNKRILLYFFEENIIIPDKAISNIITSDKYIDKYYPNYFFKEFKSFYEDYLIRRIFRRTSEIEEGNYDHFELKRKLGENDQFICKLIRNDLIDDFISHVNHYNISLTMKIETSIYETNSFLTDKKPTLIEYAAFFGSIKIFKYLYLNKVNLTASLWLYAIHGNSSELIHLLEDISLCPIDKTYQECLKEAIKCHYIDISQYIKDNLFQMKMYEPNMNVLSQSLHYCNFISFIENETNDYLKDSKSRDNFFYDMCKYDHFMIVDFLLKNYSLDINAKYILNGEFLNDIEIQQLFE